MQNQLTKAPKTHPQTMSSIRHAAPVAATTTPSAHSPPLDSTEEPFQSPSEDDRVETAKIIEKENGESSPVSFGFPYFVVLCLCLKVLFVVFPLGKCRLFV